MTQYNTLNVKLSNSQFIKLKTWMKNDTEENFFWSRFFFIVVIVAVVVVLKSAGIP